MKKIIIGSILLLSILACGKKEDTEIKEVKDYSWEKVKENSKETQVNIYMWGGSSQINSFMDKVIAKNLEEDNKIILNRVPIVDIKDTVNKLIVEKQAEKKDGSVDILWVNGENYKALKEANVLWQGFTDKLPNLEYVNEKTLATDFGESIEGREAPFGEAQFNFVYDSTKTEKPFVNYETLKKYVVANPKVFTYPAIPDFTGSAFVRNIVIDMLGEDINSMSEKDFKLALEPVWDYLNEIEPYLWREGKTYPESSGKLDTLYKNGEVGVTMGYSVNKAANKVAVGEFKDTSRSFLLNRGTLFNNHYLAIPMNASNKNGALYVINYLISSEAQILKQDPSNWGDFNILDINKISLEDKESLSELSTSVYTVPLEELAKKRVSELSPAKLEIIEEGWLKNVGKN
ncbi:MAG TPA: ABC transporter substrate-binding protein [Fusobacteriaceae bacterium]|nr:ABC transporter substrate-binding protein [Fusobacteriaceae bacterium]